MDCPLRSDAERSLLLKQPKKERREIDPDDLEEMDNAPWQEEQDDKESETASAAPVPQQNRDCIIEVFPHSAPKKFWSSIMEALGVSQCQCVVNFTTTGHPSLWLAVREKQLPAHILVDRTALRNLVDCQVSGSYVLLPGSDRML